MLALESNKATDAKVKIFLFFVLILLNYFVAVTVETISTLISFLLLNPSSASQPNQKIRSEIILLNALHHNHHLVLLKNIKNMAEFIMSSIAENVLERLVSFLREEIDLVSDVKSELSELVDTLKTIKAMNLDAEQLQTKRNQLSEWLGMLNDACYDAEDMLDEYEYETLRQQVGTHRSFKTKVGNFFPHSNLIFRRKMGKKLQKIREKLAKISADKENFHLREPVEYGRDAHMEDRETYSFVLESTVIGRGDDKEKVIRLMSNSDNKNVSVISIVGIGGLGKSTLAKLLVGDERVVGNFRLKIWVHVSRNYNLKKVVKDIISSATKKNCGDLKLEQMVPLLRETLMNQKYLLILDDVWVDNHGKWVDLKNLLMDGAIGSKIIVTTRNLSVAATVGTTELMYKLEGLPDQDCLSLFANCAFQKGDEEKYPELLTIGKEIVKKCRGVPLAVKTLGRLLYLEKDKRYWLKVKESPIWELEQEENDILPALILSYNDLPYQLKQCFVFCSIFPKDYRHNSLELIRLWIAEGLLKSPDENANLEDIGQQYIKDLSSRSFFQNVEEYGVVLTFEMHDLVHDLASFVAKKGKSYFKSDRHVVISKEVTSSLPKHNNVRTIIYLEGGAASESFAKTCISRFKYLRVLDLRDSPFEVLPSSIGNLKLLRYLNLYNSSTKKLPSSIRDLLNLQTLDLSECLKLEELPKDIWNLINLTCLYITTKQMILPEDGIRRLKSLRFLGIIKCDNLKSLGEGVQCLTALQTLLIGDCRSLESLPRSMKYLIALDTLFIYNCEKLNLKEWEEDIQGPVLSLRSSWIASLPQLVALPQWLQGATNSLQYLCIGGCPNLKALPEWLQNLTSHQKLVIEDCPELSTLPEGMHSLIKQKIVEITNCPKVAHVTKTTLDKETYDEAGTSEIRNV